MQTNQDTNKRELKSNRNIAAEKNLSRTIFVSLKGDRVNLTAMFAVCEILYRR